jgi:hypothetical protein
MKGNKKEPNDYLSYDQLPLQNPQQGNNQKSLNNKGSDDYLSYDQLPQQNPQ